MRMNDQRRLQVEVRQLKVAFEVLTVAYEELHSTGEMSNPRLAAAALHEVDRMVTSLGVAGLDRMSYDGSHVNELMRRGVEKEQADGQR